MTRREVYEARKAAGECTRCGVELPAGSESDKCPLHAAAVKAAKRLFERRKRKRKRKAGLCAFCPRKARGFRCTVCAAKHAASRPLPKGSGVTLGVDHRAQRIVEQTRKDATNRSRFHGQGARGAIPRETLDRQDVELGIEQDRRTLTALAVARRPDVPKSERKAAEAAAFGLFILGIRLRLGVLVRNRVSLEGITEGLHGDA